MSKKIMHIIIVGDGISYVTVCISFSNFRVSGIAESILKDNMNNDFRKYRFFIRCMNSRAKSYKCI